MLLFQCQTSVRPIGLLLLAHQEIFLPPDEDNYDQHGIKNLVIKYDEFGSQFEISKEIHKNSPLYKKQMMKGILEEFVELLNEHLEPLKEQT